MARKRNTATQTATPAVSGASKRPSNQAIVSGGHQVTADDAVLDASADLAALEALLGADDEILLAAPEPEVEEIADVSEDDLADAVAKEISAAEARADGYAETVADPDADPVTRDEAEDLVAEPKKKASAPRAAALSFEETLQRMHDADPLVLDSEAGPISDISEITSQVTQIKVKEKVTNLLHGVLTGGSISVYTAIALEELKKAYLEERELSSHDIRKAYEAKGYKSGTVNAQAGQMMTLFPALKMATRDARSTLKPNPNSVLLDILCS